MNVSMSISRSAARASRSVVQVACQAAATSSKRRFTTGRVAVARCSYRPIQQSIPKRAGGYGRTEGSRAFSTSPASLHNHLDPPKPGEELHITFIDKDGDEIKCEVAEGDNLLDVALEHDVEMEGACGGSCACSTCHIIVEDEAMYDKMEEPDDDENDMLDLAFGLTETSRLGCQVKMTKNLDGLRVKLPSMTRNLQASDFESK